MTRNAMAKELMAVARLLFSSVPPRFNAEVAQTIRDIPCTGSRDSVVRALVDALSQNEFIMRMLHSESERGRRFDAKLMEEYLGPELRDWMANCVDATEYEKYHDLWSDAKLTALLHKALVAMNQMH